MGGLSLIIFLLSKPIKLKNMSTNFGTILEPQQKCEVLCTSQETLPFVSWLVFDLKCCVVFNGFGLVFVKLVSCSIYVFMLNRRPLAFLKIIPVHCSQFMSRCTSSNCFTL